MKTSVFIGRFQPVHHGHIQVIADNLDKTDHFIIMIGSSFRAKTVKNPWSFEERKAMLEDAIAESLPNSGKKFTFVPLRDYLYNDSRWQSEVYAKALQHGATSDKNTQIIGSWKDDSSYYLNMFPKWGQNLSPVYHDLNATDVRDHLFGGKLLNLGDFICSSTRESIREWSVDTDQVQKLVDEYVYYRDYKKQFVSPYPLTFVTVDAVVVKSGCILVVKRKFPPGRDQIALPGGFLNAGESIDKATIRELKEETRIRMATRHIQAAAQETRVFDHPYRDPRGRVITHVTLFDLGYGHLPDVKGDSDAKGAFWMPMADVYKAEDAFYCDHYDIIYQMVSQF